MTENSNNTPKTFKDFGLEFIPNEDCITCNTGSCHNNATSRIDGKEYNVHITVNYDENEYYVIAAENGSTDSPFDIFEIFQKEEDAVKFVCDRFNWFKCF
jgi:hypothetical protein